jgi:hypothetical protein
MWVLGFSVPQFSVVRLGLPTRVQVQSVTEDRQSAN